MGRTKKRIRGLVDRGGVWHIDKRIGGRRLCESTGEHDLNQAEVYLAKRIEETRKALIYGERPVRSFRAAATRYLRENQHLRSIGDYALHLRQLDPFIGDLDLRSVHIGTLGPFIEARRKARIKSKSINLALGVVRHILNIAASEWMDESGLTWLERAPKIKLLPVTDARKPYPLSWEEQTRLYSVARSVVGGQRGQHPKYVFTYCGERQKKINNSGWQGARKRAGLPQVRVHDLKHTFGRRLRAAGVSFEDRQDLLGHKSGRITSHYSAAELNSLIDAANQVVGQGSRKSPALVMLKKKAANALAVTA